LSSEPISLPERRRAAPETAADFTARFAPIGAEARAAIAATPYLKECSGGIYADLDPDLTLDYMLRRFVRPLARHVDIASATMLDCASGFGWLSFAYLKAGGARSILVDMDARRLDAARDIARRLGVEERCGFVRSALQDIDLKENDIDVFASVETLEHVGRANVAACISTISHLARRAVLLTSPNYIFPVIAHDTGLPLAHWLPAKARRFYAAKAGRLALDHGNHFLRPWDLWPLAAKFRPVTAYQTFDTMAEFDAFFPHYMPYGGVDKLRRRAAPKAGQRTIMQVLGGVLGPWSFALAPNLASIWLRRG
jgi:hypothetical protein